MDVKIGIIGGSGVYRLENIEILAEKNIETPYGKTSDKISIIKIGDVKVAFLPRHGKGHTISPSEIPAQANIYALKILGVQYLLSISAVGSLQENIPPEDFILPDQIIDRTRLRKNTFFSEGIVGHVSFADPFCPEMRQAIYPVLKEFHPQKVHPSGTYICMEGPAFSTRAESQLYRSWGANVIGMTALPEAKLAREAEIAYQLIAMSTDYDCWKSDKADVDIEVLIKHMTNNNNRVKNYLAKIIEVINKLEPCSCHQASKYAILSKPEDIPPATKQRLKPLFTDYIK